MLFGHDEGKNAVQLCDGNTEAVSTKMGGTGKKANEFVDLIYPVGSIYMSVNKADPATLFGGTWEQWGMGRTLIGVGANEENTYTGHGSAAAGYVNHSEAEIKGGEYTHLLSTSEMPAHYHTADGNLTAATNGAHTHNATCEIVEDRCASGNDYARIATSGTATAGIVSVASGGAHTHDITGNTSSAGGGDSHNNLQPYITCYMWKRVA